MRKRVALFLALLAMIAGSLLMVALQEKKVWLFYESVGGGKIKYT